MNDARTASDVPTRGRVIEVDEGFAVNAPLKDGEIAADAPDAEGHRTKQVHDRCHRFASDVTGAAGRMAAIRRYGVAVAFAAATSRRNYRPRRGICETVNCFARNSI
jgi:hypothetical protein